MKNSSRTRRVLLPVLVALAALVAAGSIGPDPAGAADPHRAAVIVDTGTQVHRVVITFTEDSITGISALERAGANPAVYGFPGQGGAVCRIFGVGRDPGPNCLGGQDGDARYWAYFRAPAGTSSFTYSRVGAGTAKVSDGDVEGWKFGTGTAPAFASLQSLLPPQPGPDPGPPPATSTSAPGSNPAAGDGSAPGSRAATAAAIGGAAVASSPPSSTLPQTGAEQSSTAKGAATSSAGRTRSDASEAADRREAATETALASSSTDEGGSTASFIWFGVLLALIVIAIVVARRLRLRNRPA